MQDHRDIKRKCHAIDSRSAGSKFKADDAKSWRLPICNNCGSQDDRDYRSARAPNGKGDLWRPTEKLHCCIGRLHEIACHLTCLSAKAEVSSLFAQRGVSNSVIVDIRPIRAARVYLALTLSSSIKRCARLMDFIVRCGQWPTWGRRASLIWWHHAIASGGSGARVRKVCCPVANQLLFRRPSRNSITNLTCCCFLSWVTSSKQRPCCMLPLHSPACSPVAAVRHTSPSANNQQVSPRSGAARPTARPHGPR